MKLFVTFGSWGEIAPLLEIALRLQDKGESVMFATTPDWASRVEEYGMQCARLPRAEKHADTLSSFVKAHLLGRTKGIYSVIEQVRPSSIVSAFYCFPAQAYAATHRIPCVITTTSPHYFMETEAVPELAEVINECAQLCEFPQYPLAGIYPWYFHNSIGAEPVGFPELRPLSPLSDEVLRFIEEPYGVISCGTILTELDLSRMVNAIHAHGLKCLYLGSLKCRADLSAFVNDHRAAVAGAKVAITHAGVGTTVDCMDVPMVVSPLAYDQFYNANRLVDLKCAVGVQDSYIKAISEALKPRSYLPNYFNLDQFLRLFDEYPPGEPNRHAADVSQCAQVH